MPTPSGRTYHYGEKKPLADPDSGIHTVSHDGPHGQPERNVPETSATVWDLLRQKADEWTASLGSMTQDAWQSIERLAGRAPLATLGVGLAVGFLSGQCLVHGKKSA